MMVNMVNNLVGGFNLTPLKNDGVSSSVWMMTFPTEWKNNPTVPNHQPELYWKLHKPWDGIG